MQLVPENTQLNTRMLAGCSRRSTVAGFSVLVRLTVLHDLYHTPDDQQDQHMANHTLYHWVCWRCSARNSLCLSSASFAMLGTSQVKLPGCIGNQWFKLLDCVFHRPSLFACHLPTDRSVSALLPMYKGQARAASHPSIDHPNCVHPAT